MPTVVWVLPRLPRWTSRSLRGLRWASRAAPSRRMVSWVSVAGGGGGRGREGAGRDAPGQEVGVGDIFGARHAAVGGEDAVLDGPGGCAEAFKQFVVVRGDVDQRRRSG
ncbi:MAG: hypothetical protein U0841_20135 [Chloroflexia bacterium]